MIKTRNIKVELPFAFCEETMRLYFKRKEDGREWR